MNPFASRPALAVATLALLAAAFPSTAQPASPTTPAVRPHESWTKALPKEVLGRFVRALPPAAADDYAADKIRIAVFGTEDVLWDGSPVSLETRWALDRVRSLAAGRPEWKTTPPFSAALSDDPEAVADLTPEDLARLTGAAVAGLEPQEVHRDVLSWAKAAREDGRAPADLARPAIRELLAFLRSWGFRNYVVSDGPLEVTRALVEALYALPAYRVIAPPSPVEVRDPAGATRVVFSAEPPPPATGESRLRDVMRQVGARPLFVAASRAKDAPFIQWSAGSGGPFLSLVFFETGRNPGDRFQSLRPAVPVGRWTVVVPSRDWKARSAGPKANVK